MTTHPLSQETKHMDQSVDLVERYVAMWNEGDPDARREAIQTLWARDGAHMLQPPEEILRAAAAIGFRDPVLTARGHDALEARVSRAYDEFVAPGEFRFRPRSDAMRLADVVTFGWEMVSTADGEVTAAGREFLILNERGQIRSDYQFITQ
jgi:hypothetical protein